MKVPAVDRDTPGAIPGGGTNPSPPDACDSSHRTDYLPLRALSVESRQKVNAWARKALEAGGIEAHPKSDLGFMYTRTIQDLDGHVLETFYVDIKKFPNKK